MATRKTAGYVSFSDDFGLSRGYSEIREWRVVGDEGAVTFLVLPHGKDSENRTPATIGIHARKGTGKPVPCDILFPQGKCHESQKDQGAYELWLLSGQGKDEKIIYEVLEGTYRSEFKLLAMALTRTT